MLERLERRLLTDNVCTNSFRNEQLFYVSELITRLVVFENSIYLTLGFWLRIQQRMSV